MVKRSPRRDTSRAEFSFSDEIMMEEDGKLNFYVEASFDVDAAFGAFVLTDKNDDWLNIYANYDIAEDRPATRWSCASAKEMAPRRAGATHSTQPSRMSCCGRWMRFAWNRPA